MLLESSFTIAHPSPCVKAFLSTDLRKSFMFEYWPSSRSS